MKKLLCLLLIMTTVCACSKPLVFLRCDLGGQPDTLDAQFAESAAEQTVIANVFEGLVRIGEGGEIIAGCAEDWEITDGGKKYTFTLRENLRWSNDAALTADDFVFALSRLFAPEAQSPFAEQYDVIKNAKAVLSKECEASQLGVYAPDERTVVIELEHEDNSFLGQLARTPAMPCSREFFSEQKGRYGLDKSSLITNGAYVLYSWGEETVKIRRNDSYHTPTAIDGVNFSLQNKATVERFENGDVDVLLASFADADLKALPAGELIYDNSWALILNPKSGGLDKKTIRSAIIAALGEEVFSEYITQPIKSAEGLVAPAQTVFSLPYRDTVGAVSAPILPESVRAEYIELLDGKQLGGLTLLVCSDGPGHDIGGIMQRDWQTELPLYCNIEALPLGELLARVGSGRFDMALSPLPVQSGDRTLGLGLFEKLLGEDGAAVFEKLAVIRESTDEEAAAKLIFETEQLLVDECIAMPVYDTPSVFVCADGVSGVVLDKASGVFLFTDAVSEKES